MECDYMQTNSLDYASPAEQAEYDRYIDIIQAMIDNTTPDLSEMQQTYSHRSWDVDFNEDDEDLSDCRRRW